MNPFTVIFYEPIFNLLVYLYNIVPGHDLGVAIILLTLIVRLALYIPSKKSITAQRDLATLQPEIDKLKERYKDDKEKMGPELMALYKKRKINPLSSCLPTLIQLPFLFAIYRVFWNGLSDENAMDALYSFVANPGVLNTTAFGFFDLSEKSIIVALLAGAAQFWQSKMMVAKKSAGGGAAAAMGQQMVYIMPLVTIVIGSQFRAGLTFYWLLTTLFSVAQQYIVLGARKKKEAEQGVEVIDKK
jgi:YidC/Oxa1 family membrane protein insertase